MIEWTDKQNRKRRMLGVMVALWVSLGVQPCAAAAVSDLDCPHCPPEQEQPQNAMHKHCDPVEVVKTEAGVALTADCCEADEGALDARQGQLDLKPVSDGLAGPPTSLLTGPTLAAVARQSVTVPPDWRPSPVPLHILYCVYRD